eukprot:5342741-Pleurochrysis_carterae.AAC.3
MAAPRESRGYFPSVRLKVLRWVGVLDAGAGSLVVLWGVAGSGAGEAEAVGIGSAGVGCRRSVGAVCETCALGACGGSSGRWACKYVYT